MKPLHLLSRYGFTLIEVGLSILILSFALLAIAEMQIIAMQGSSFANQLSQSTLLAQDRLKSLMLLPYNHPSLFRSDGLLAASCEMSTQQSLEK